MNNKGKLNFKSIIFLLILGVALYLFFDLFFIPLVDSAFNYGDGIMEQVKEAEEILNRFEKP